MNDKKQTRRRSAAAAVEAAVSLPVLFFLLLALVIGGMVVFRYQQVACQAREAARWACVRGGDYQKDTDQLSPTQQQILEQAVLPLAVGMDPAALSCHVQWIDQGSNTVQDWDSAPKDVKSVTPKGEYVSNTVRVTITYQWTWDFLLGPVSLQSVSELPMSY
jgi:Flp pilus assembly protein TadG